MQSIVIKDIILGEKCPLAFICGPCVIESEESCLKAAESLKKIFLSCSVPFIFKSSYDKANRLSIHSFRGPGLDEGLRILERVRKELDIPVLTDIHSTEEAKAVAEVCDVIQIPALLCRQTDILVAAASTGKVVNIKKGQFMAPWDMKNMIEKMTECGNHNILLTERGSSFGYNNLVSDMRSLLVMQQLGYPVCYDATHSVQLPGAAIGGKSTGGNREYVFPLARAAAAVGVQCIFMEAHREPEKALSDSASMVSFQDLEVMVKCLVNLHSVTAASCSKACVYE